MLRPFLLLLGFRACQSSLARRVLATRARIKGERNPAAFATAFKKGSSINEPARKVEQNEEENKYVGNEECGFFCFLFKKDLGWEEISEYLLLVPVNGTRSPLNLMKGRAGRDKTQAVIISGTGREAKGERREEG